MADAVPTIASVPIRYKIALKLAVVEALRLIFSEQYPDSLLNDLFINLEYPQKPQQYPAVIVGYQERDLRTAGPFHFEYRSPNNVQKRWYFEGTITMDIIAQTSLDRDYISDHFVHMFAFATTNEYTASFFNYIETNEDIIVNVNKDILTPAGETVESGVPWGFTDQLLYRTAYAFDVMGEFLSGVVQNAYVRGVNEIVEISE
jgi:hypothetical protein